MITPKREAAVTIQTVVDGDAMAEKGPSANTFVSYSGEHDGDDRDPRGHPPWT